jgi:hypothetical protein
MKRLPRQASLAALAGARRLRRGVALLACLGVLAWTLVSATHWHDEAAGNAGGHTAECVLCHGTPAGAAPPQQSILHAPPPPRVLAAAPLARPAPLAGPLSSYRSRAPPAA